MFSKKKKSLPTVSEKDVDKGIDDLVKDLNWMPKEKITDEEFQLLKKKVADYKVALAKHKVSANSSPKVVSKMEANLKEMEERFKSIRDDNKVVAQQKMKKQ